MSFREQLERFVQLCQAGDTLQAIERFYAEDVVVFENHERARAGRAACLAYEREAISKLSAPATLKVKAYAADETRGVTFIEWVIRFMGREGRPMRLEEVAVQRWSGARIVEERSCFLSAQSRRKPSPSRKPRA